MSSKHLFGREDWYIISITRGDKGEPYWRHGLKDLHAGKTEIHTEWCWLPKHGHGFGFTFGRNGGESDIGLSIYLGRLGSLWLRAGTPITKWIRVRPHMPHKYDARHYGIMLVPYNGCLIRFEWNNLSMGGRTRDERRWWHDWNFQRRMILGRVDCEVVITNQGDCAVPMPEGNYPSKWKCEQRTWRHTTRRGRLWDRIFNVTVRTDYWLDVEGGIPHEGKGENSWDCGMDGLFGCGGNTLEDAIANAVRHSLRDRQRYGGPHDLTRPMTVREAESA